MSHKLFFEDIFKRKMNELPLPDENESWQKMKQLLDEKEKRKPFVFLITEKIIGGVMLLLLLCLWLFISPEKEENKTTVSNAKYNASGKENRHHKTAAVSISDQLTENKKNNRKDDSDHLASSGQAQTKQESALYQKNISFKKIDGSNLFSKQLIVKKKQSLSGNLNKKNGLIKKVLNINAQNGKLTLQDSIAYLYNANKTDDFVETLASIQKQDNLLLSLPVDSSNKTLAVQDSLQKATTNKAITKTTISIKKRNAYFIDAGIGLGQQIPVGGQKIVSYNYNGNKTLLSDYVPSVYIRLQKDKQWFLQGEFSYATPRLIKEFTYWQKTKVDYNHSNTTITSNRLQKAWYNEIPASFNFYVHPSWSVGAGATYSWLRGAVENKETIINNTQSGVQTVANQMLPIKGFTDSFLYKTQTSFMLQTHYQKDKWSFDLRYLQNVQPFIIYTLPDGIKKDKKNSSLELLIRYRLFQSSKFRLRKL